MRLNIHDEQESDNTHNKHTSILALEGSLYVGSQTRRVTLDKHPVPMGSPSLIQHDKHARRGTPAPTTTDESLYLAPGLKKWRTTSNTPREGSCFM